MKRQWNAATSGAAMKKLRERQGLDKRQVANQLGVHIRMINAIEDGIEPQQRVMAQLDELYEMDEADWKAVYTPPASSEDERRDYDERRADLTKKVAAMDEAGWQPVRFGGQR
jgi:transcriptional regulator with XRE-family HTH domain